MINEKYIAYIPTDLADFSKGLRKTFKTAPLLTDSVDELNRYKKEHPIAQLCLTRNVHHLNLTVIKEFVNYMEVAEKQTSIQTDISKQQKVQIPIEKSIKTAISDDSQKLDNKITKDISTPKKRGPKPKTKKQEDA